MRFYPFLICTLLLAITPTAYCMQEDLEDEGSSNSITSKKQDLVFLQALSSKLTIVENYVETVVELNKNPNQKNDEKEFQAFLKAMKQSTEETHKHLHELIYGKPRPPCYRDPLFYKVVIAPTAALVAVMAMIMNGGSFF
jgi:hypothetical protein